MESEDLDELFEHARRIGGLLHAWFAEVTGEDFDLESGVRHYPLAALGIAASAGALAGWWLGRRNRPALPPPPPEPDTLPRLNEIANRLRKARPSPDGERVDPLDYVERLFPESADRIRRIVPESTREEAAEMAREWVDNVVEPRIKRGLENMVSNVSQTRAGMKLLQVLERLDSGEDHELEDPPNGE